MLAVSHSDLLSSDPVIALHVASMLCDVPTGKFYSMLCHMMLQVCTEA